MPLAHRSGPGHRAALLVVVVIAAGCRSTAERRDAAAAPAPSVAAPCPPLTISIDGVARRDWQGLAVTLTSGVYQTEQVMLFAGAPVACPAVLAPSFRPPAGTLQLRAYYHPEAQGLGTEAHTEMVVPGVTLVAKADRPGAVTTLCVRAARFTPSAGALAGQVVAIAGTVAGAHCGTLDLTPR